MNSFYAGAEVPLAGTAAQVIARIEAWAALGSSPLQIRFDDFSWTDGIRLFLAAVMPAALRLALRWPVGVLERCLGDPAADRRVRVHRRAGAVRVVKQGIVWEIIGVLPVAALGAPGSALDRVACPIENSQ